MWMGDLGVGEVLGGVEKHLLERGSWEDGPAENTGRRHGGRSEEGCFHQTFAALLP